MKFTILGCGSSMGVPRADGNFGNCNPNNKKNIRTRCSAIIQGKSLNILIDTSPDMRQQLINNNVKNVDKVLFSHMHADQTHGINDLRVFYLKNRKPVDVYADLATQKYLNKSFSYCFKNNSSEYPATLKMNSIKKDLFFKDGKNKIHIRSLKVKHGSVNCTCFIINKKLAYISDVSEIDKKDFKFLTNLKYLIVECLWYREHPSHLNLDKSLRLINDLSPKKAVLTNLHSDLDYNKLKRKLKRSIVPAYDGMRIYL